MVAGAVDHVCQTIRRLATLSEPLHADKKGAEYGLFTLLRRTYGSTSIIMIRGVANSSFRFSSEAFPTPAVRFSSCYSSYIFDVFPFEGPVGLIGGFVYRVGESTTVRRSARL